MLRLLASAALAVGFAVPATASASLSVDDFAFSADLSPLVVSEGGPMTGYTEPGLPTSSTIGGERRTTLTWRSGNGELIADWGGETGSLLRLQALGSSSTAPGELELLYAGSGDGGLDQDLSGQGNGILATFGRIGSGLQLTVTLCDMSANCASTTSLWPGSANPVARTIPFSELPTVDLTEVHLIRVVAAPTIAPADFDLTSLRVELDSDLDGIPDSATGEPPAAGPPAPSAACRRAIRDARRSARRLRAARRSVRALVRRGAPRRKIHRARKKVRRTAAAHRRNKQRRQAHCR